MSCRPSNLGIIQLKKSTVEAIWGDTIDTGCGLLKITSALSKLRRLYGRDDRLECTIHTCLGLAFQHYVTKTLQHQ
jgi:hypothetical protein